MDILILMGLVIPTACVIGIVFLVRVIIEEEREKKEKLAFVKAFSARHNNKRIPCPHCGCLPCHCGS
tara:strand:- start:341 stop:541 length:201 start_codon:yes stop_codon:yes gene_type:complete